MSHATTTLDLLDRSREALVGACAAPAASARHGAASLAALRAGAALVAAGSADRATGSGPSRRPVGLAAAGAGPHDVWSLVVGVAPELVEWAQRFADATERQGRVDAGVLRVGAREADDLLRDAETFLDLVARRLGVPAAPAPRRLVPVRSA